jgi:hypothetical protein
VDRGDNGGFAAADLDDGADGVDGDVGEEDAEDGFVDVLVARSS